MPLFRTSEYYIKQILEKEVKLLTSRLEMTSGPDIHVESTSTRPTGGTFLHIDVR